MKNNKITETKYLSLTRKVTGYKTTESWASVPHVTFVYEADVTEMMAALKSLHALNPSEKITLNTVLLKICVEAIKAAPQINARIKYNATSVTGRIQTMRNIDISMPWILENGEMVAVNLRNFENKTLREMQQYINMLATKIQNCNVEIPLYQVSMHNLMQELKRGHLIKVVSAVAGAFFGHSKVPSYDAAALRTYKKMPDDDKIIMQDLMPGTITISNIGSIYKEQKGFIGLLEIIPPQIFAIGVGSIQEKAGVINNGKNRKRLQSEKCCPCALHLIIARWTLEKLSRS